MFIGDFVVAFHTDCEVLRGRMSTGSCTPVKCDTNWRLGIQPLERGWKGYPLSAIRASDWHLWFLGELYGPPQSKPRYGDLLQQIVTGAKAATELNGHFLLCGWNEQSRQWHIWTDRFGTLHMYYATDGQRSALGTFFPTVAGIASRRHLDWIGLTGFFGFGFFPQDRTYFEDVRILRPASHYVFDENGRLQSQKRYWQWWHEPDPRRSYDDTVREFDDVLSDVLTDQTKEGRIAIPISGGLDSRTTVAVITENGKAIEPSLWSYSYGYSSDSVETHIARQVARVRGLPFEAFTIRPYLFDRLDLVLDSVEGFQDVTQCRQAAVKDQLACDADYLIAAHWGDVWLDDMGLVNETTQSSSDKQILRHTLDKLQKVGRVWLLEHLCEPHLGGDDPEVLLRSIARQELSEVQHIKDPDFRMKAFKTDQWSFRWTTASLRMFQSAAFPRLPFYDTRMADFFCTVPSQFVRGRQLQIDHLKRFAPDLARITWQAYDASLFRYQHFNSWLLPKRAFKKAWRILTRKQNIERNWEVQFLSDQGRRGLDHWLLRPGLRLHEFVPPSIVRRLLEDFYTAPLRDKRGYTVSMLLTFSASLERYN